MGLFKREKRSTESVLEAQTKENIDNNDIQDGIIENTAIPTKAENTNSTYTQWLAKETQIQQQTQKINQNSKKIDTNDLLNKHTANTPVPIPNAINDKLDQVSKLSWKVNQNKDKTPTNVDFDINSAIDLQKEQPHKQFYLNLHYLLTIGFNTLMCFNGNPFAINLQEDKIITQEDKQFARLNDEQLRRRGFNALDNGENKDNNKSGFNFSALSNNPNSIERANKLPITVLVHNWTMAFNELNTKNNNLNKINRLEYQSDLEKEYKFRAVNMKERIISNLKLAKTWVNLPWQFQSSRNINEDPYIKGYPFPKLSADGDNDTSINFFMHARELDALNITFITATKSNDVTLLKAHYTSDSKKVAFKEELDLYADHTKPLLNLIKSLPAPFNYVQYQYKNSVDSSGARTTQKNINFLTLLEQWNNVNFESMIHRNANTYTRSSFFLDKKSNKYQPLKLKNLDELYKVFIMAIFNIIKCLLYFEDANGNELDIASYLNLK